MSHLNKRAQKVVKMSCLLQLACDLSNITVNLVMVILEWTVFVIVQRSGGLKDRTGDR